MGRASIVDLSEYRKSKRGQAILLKRMIELHLAEAGEKLGRRFSADSESYPYISKKEEKS